MHPDPSRPMVTEADDLAAPPQHDGPLGGRGWTVATVVLIVAVLGATIALAAIHVPYVIISPGGATSLDAGVVSISGTTTYAHRGSVLYLTVRVTNDDPTLLRYLV